MTLNDLLYFTFTLNDNRDTPHFDQMVSQIYRAAIQLDKANYVAS